MNSLFRVGLFVSVFLVLAFGCFVQTHFAQCAPVSYQKTFQRVFRQHKIFLEGVADLTGDGKPDAYGYQRLNFRFQNLVVLPNDGNGGFGEPVVINGSFPVGDKTGTIESQRLGNVTIGDVNLDGRLDMVVNSQYSPRSAHTILNNGANSFTEVSVPTFLFDNERILQIADINNDGRGDIITVFVHPSVDSESGVLNGIYYRLGNANGAFGAQVQVASDGSTSPVLIDYNNDTKIDIVYSYYGTDNRFYYKILTNQGGGLFSSGMPVQADYFSVFATADFNNDGRPDLVGNGTNETVFLFNNGNGGFNRVNYPNALVNQTLPWYHRMFVFDYNGDGHKDILDTVNIPASFTNPTGRKKLYSVFLNNGSGVFTRTDFQRPFLGIPADINGDNRSEQIIFANSTAFGAPALNASNEAAIVVRQGICLPPPVTGQAKVLDFGGDGISDLAVWNANNGNWRYVSNFNEGTLNWGLGSLGDIPAPGDFDGDGKTDTAVYRNSTGTWWFLRSSDNTWSAVRFGLTGDVPVAADYNGGGKTDIGVYRPSDGTWYILTTETQQVSIIRFGIGEDKPVQQDYDGDGKTDIAVFRPSTGFWYYLKSSDGGFAAIKWGISTDVPVPADYDWDGKADPAIYRQGTWFILRSFDYDYNTFQFGSSGDVPMAVDSNGDGLFEPGYFRPNNFKWFATAQENLTSEWGTFGATQEIPIRLMLPNN